MSHTEAHSCFGLIRIRSGDGDGAAQQQIKTQQVAAAHLKSAPKLRQV